MAKSSPLKNLEFASASYYALAIVLVLLGCPSTIPFFVMGRVFMLLSSNPGERNPEQTLLFGWFFIASGVIAVVMIIGLAVLMFLNARYLNNRENHRYCLFVSAVSCLQIPLGTALGLYTLTLLSKPEVKAAFDRPASPDGDGFYLE